MFFNFCVAICDKIVYIWYWSYVIFVLALPSLAFACGDCFDLQNPHYRHQFNAPDGIQHFF